MFTAQFDGKVIGHFSTLAEATKAYLDAEETAMDKVVRRTIGLASEYTFNGFRQHVKEFKLRKLHEAH